MERRKPSKQQLESLYGLINRLLPDADVYYTPKELENYQLRKEFELL